MRLKRRHRPLSSLAIVLFVIISPAFADPQPLVMPVEGATAQRARFPVLPKRRVKPDLSALPLDEIQGPYRERVLEILRQPIALHQGTPEMFPCHPGLLEWMIRHPVTVGDYWKQLGMTLAEVEPTEGGYLCRDDYGSVVHFYPVCEKPNLRIAYCVGESPAGILPVKMRAELVMVHQYRFQHYEGAGDYVVQQLDGYASASGMTLKMAMRLAPGQSEQMIETCVQEVKIYFSVMCRLMQLRPHWCLERFPAVAERLNEREKQELETILRSLPPTRRTVPVFRQIESADMLELAIDPSASPAQ